MRKILLSCAIVSTFASSIGAQTVKDTLRYEDADLWRAVEPPFGGGSTPALSADGKWVIYVNTGKTGDTLVAQSTASSTSWRIPLGSGSGNPSVLLGGEQILFAKAAGPAGPRGRDLEFSLLRVRDGVVTPADWMKGIRRYFVDPSGQRIIYADEHDRATTLYLRDARSGSVRELLAAPGKLGELVFDTSGTQVAFLWNGKPDPRAAPKLDLYYARLTENASAQRIVANNAFGPDSGIVTNAGTPILAFTGGGTALRLAVGIPTIPPAPGPPRPQPRAGLRPDSTTLELWHYLDPVLAVSQRNASARFPAVRNVIFDMASKRIVDLATQRPFAVQVSGDASYALISNYAPTTVDAGWKRVSRSVELLDLKKGARRSLGTVVGPDPKFSPASKYVYWFDSGDWYVHSLQSQTTVKVTRQLPAISWKEKDSDTNNIRYWDEAAWAPGDERILLTDEYDIWAIDPRLRLAPRVVTDSIGAREHLSFRLFRGLSDWAQVTNLDTRAEGFYRIDVTGKAKPRRVVMEDVHFGPVRGRPLTKAAAADVYMVTKETISQFPDLWVGSSLSALHRVTDVNPQQKQFRWATAELANWRGDDGKELQGILYKPEDFDSTKKYPMVVSYYEVLADSYHQYYTPEHFPRPLYGLNPVVYASRGYLVFVPDILFTTGKPGESVLSSVLPGVRSLMKRGFVKPNGIGCLGVSWGGWETFQLVTHTDLFAGCVVDEGSVDFVSMAGYLYALDWPLQRYYENGQGRLTGSLWEKPEEYIANSPIWRLDHVTTPMIIIANDGDEVVPWWQGLAAFMGLRRLGKEAYLFNYRGETHGLSSPYNVRDRDRRVHEFFDATLRGAPKPAWMKEWPSR